MSTPLLLHRAAIYAKTIENRSNITIPNSFFYYTQHLFELGTPYIIMSIDIK
jgi:hypothetical protein